jgi:hypothetical protein
MQESSSAKSLIVQLSSLINYLDKVSSGGASFQDLELMSAVNGVLKDCVLLQKNIKLKKAKQKILAETESYISDQDFQRLSAIIEGLKPSINVSQQRVSRLIGQMSPDGKIDPAAVKENVLAVFETLKKRLDDSGEDAAELQDLTLQSAEAACEVVRRLVSQELHKQNA